MRTKKRTATIRDLAKHAQVSPATVSRVLNSTGYVSETTRQGVEKAIRELNYFPNARARSLRGGPSGLIALIIPDILNVYYTNLSRTIESQLRQRGYTMLLGVHQEDTELYTHYLHQFRELKVDGMIIVPAPASSNKATIRSLLAHGMPMVELNRQQNGDLLDVVLVDNFQAACLTTDYLITLGHSQIALIVGSAETTTGGNRIRGYQWSMTQAGLPLRPEFLKIGEFSKAYGMQATKELLAVSPRPTAIVSASNRLLMGTMTILSEQHIAIPDDISVVAFDDSEWLDFWQPPITTVDVGIDEMGSLAVELLLRWIDSETPPREPRTYSLSTSLIKRASCKLLSLDPLADS